MTVPLINPNACVEIGRNDFLAADLAAATERRASAAAQRIQAQRDTQAAERDFISSRECQHGADREEADQHLSDAHHLVTLAHAVARQAEPTFRALQRAGLAEADEDFATKLAELFADRLTDRALARVVLAAMKEGIQ